VEAPGHDRGGDIRVAAHVVHLWLDNSGHIRQVSYSELQSMPGRLAMGPAFVKGIYGEQLSFSRFGVPVDFTVPKVAKAR
jgi:hypothetical protein